MEHEGYTYIFLTAQRKCWHHELPSDWEEVAWERFSYVECGVYRKRTANVTDAERADWEPNMEPNEDFISPAAWEWPEPKTLIPRKTVAKVRGGIVGPDGKTTDERRIAESAWKEVAYRQWLGEMFQSMAFLMRSGAWTAVNAYMATMSIRPFERPLAVLRFLPRDDRLPEWDRLRDHVRDALIQSGDMEVTRAMRGLLGPKGDKS